MLIREGADVIRLNLSFAPLEEPYGAAAAKALDWLNEHRDGLARHVAALGDLPGPKIRLGMEAEQTLEMDDEFLLDFRGRNRFAPAERGASVLVSELPFEQAARVDGYDHIGDYLRQAKGDAIFSIGDGKVLLRAVREDHGMVACVVVKAGVISAGQGFTIKRARIDSPPFQEPDQRALDFLLEKGGDAVAMIGVSFVRNKEDVNQVRRYVEDHLMKRRSIASRTEARLLAPAIIAKIETLDAWENIDEILDVADGVMIARGDLGLQLDPQEVPAIQKRIIRKCNLRGKPVITATQMLDSMEGNMEPTRAEAADVFNAILDGTDAVMLSGETAKGEYPFHAVRMMARIAEQAERFDLDVAPDRRLQDILKSSRSHFDASERQGEEAVTRQQMETTNRTSQAACVLSEVEGCQAIIALTASGRTARMIARFRPKLPIIGVTHDRTNARKLALSFGVYPLCIGDGGETLDEVFEAVAQEAKQQDYLFWQPGFRLLQPGGRVVFSGGAPLRVSGATNLIQIREV
jgi:pyruvate kinase